MDNNINNAYRRARVVTATRGKIVVMLYDEALRQIDIARDSIDGGIRSYDLVNDAITKAHDVMSELMASLNIEEGGEIARNLFNLYSFFCNALMEANLNKDRKYLDEIVPLIENLRSAWDQIADNAEQSTTFTPETGINISG